MNTVTTPTPAATKPRVEPVLTTVVAAGTITLPKVETNRGSKSAYDFASLTEVGAMLGVKNKTKAELTSVITNANNKAKVKRVDATGKPVFKMNEIKDAVGNITQVPTSEQEIDVTAHYYALDVTPEITKQLKGTPLEGSKALIVRDK